MPASLAAAAPLAIPNTAGSLDRIKTAAGEFEAVFLANMLEPMFEGVGDDDPFNGAGSATWRSLHVEEMARAVARAGGIGLAAHVERHLIAMQEIEP